MPDIVNAEALGATIRRARQEYGLDEAKVRALLGTCLTIYQMRLPNLMPGDERHQRILAIYKEEAGLV